MLVHLTKSNAVAVHDLAAASAAVRAFWGSKSSRAFYRDPKAGLIVGDDGVIACHVSYNGRVWEGTARMSVGAREIAV